MSPAQVPPPSTRRALLVLWLLLGSLVLQRLVHHHAFLEHSPLSLVTIADGRLTERAARDVLRYFPLGSQPFQIDALYPYALALPMRLFPFLGSAVLLQLGLAVVGWVLFYRAGRHRFGPAAALISTSALLAYPAIRVYENKPTGVQLSVLLSIVVLWAVERHRRRGSPAAAAVAGMCLALGALIHPFALLGLPCLAIALRRQVEPRKGARWLAVPAVLAGVVLALGPVTLRNQAVTGNYEVFPRLALGLPLLMGQNRAADGRWNEAGGRIDRTMGRGRSALVAGLGVHHHLHDAQDVAIEAALRSGATELIREAPGEWVRVHLSKLYDLLGNGEPTSQYDLLGESAMLGGFGPSLPFGVLLAFGVLGWLALRRPGGERSARDDGMAWALAAIAVGPVVGCLAGYVSTEQRLPLAVALAFAAGPGLLALIAATRDAGPAGRSALWPLALAAALLGQAHLPRAHATAPSAWHHFHLADAYERIGNVPDALRQYGKAIEADATEARFMLQQARLLLRFQAVDAARGLILRLEALPNVPYAMGRLIKAERMRLDILERQQKARAEAAPPS